MRVRPGANEQARMSCETVAWGMCERVRPAMLRLGLVRSIVKRMTKPVSVHNLTNAAPINVDRTN